MSVLLALAIVQAVSTGNDLKRECDPQARLAMHYWCAGFLEGVAVMNGSAFCTPDGVTVGQMRDVLLKYLDTHPAHRHRDYRAITLEALVRAFPCPKKKY